MEALSCSCMAAHPAPRSHIEVLPARADAPLACTLGPRASSARHAEFAALFAELRYAKRFEGGFLWQFRNAPGLERRLRALARAEHACCPFLTFAVSVEGEHVVFRACGPERADAVVDLFYRMPLASGAPALPV